jgi:parallel beta-helix repeat protein
MKVMKRVESFILLSLLVGSCFAVLVSVPEAASAYTLHVPIYINGNAGFTPANGVTGGSGTPADPYIIEGWEIDASTAHGIAIWNTDAHFVIRGIYVHSGFRDYDDIVLAFVANGSIEDSLLSGDGYGIGLGESSNITIKSNVITDNLVGIDSYKSVDVNITANDVTNNEEDGIHVYYSDDNVFTANSITGNNRGIWVDESDGATITGNTISNNSLEGIRLRHSETAFVRANEFINDGVYLDSFNVPDVSSHTITRDNLVNGLPIYYYKDCSGLDVNGIQVGQVLVANCSDVKISNLTIAGTDAGIELTSVTRAIVETSSVSDSLYGILLAYSDDATIKANRFNGNGWGVFSGRVADFAIAANNISNSDSFGIYLGICDETTISNNSVYSNTEGIYLYYSTNTTVHHNSVVNNVNHSYDNMGAENSWDDGYPSGGNYWSNYTGVDQFGGPNQDQPGPDGIGDTAYLIDTDSRDRYPLMAPRNTPPIIVHNPHGDVSVNEAIIITANVTDAVGVRVVYLHYRAVGASGFAEVRMTMTTGDTYEAIIPAQSESGTVHYCINATDNWGNEARHPQTGYHSLRIVEEENRPLTDSTFIMVTAAAGIAVVIAIIAAIVLFLKRRKRRGQGAKEQEKASESPPKSSV